jgi:hypothetical protein
MVLVKPFLVVALVQGGGLRATSSTRLRARGHNISSSFGGGKVGGGPSLMLHTTLEGPTVVSRTSP